jgi:polysaccharide biosynthesis transport protein
VGSEQTGLSLEQLLGILRRRILWIALCCALVAGAAYGFSEQQTKKYTATASLVFNDNQLNEQVAGLPTVSNTSPQAQENTNVKLVQLGDMATVTATQLGAGLTGEAVKESIAVSAQAESNIVNVAATSTSPALAADIANNYTSRFVSEQESRNHKYYSAALTLVNKQLAALSPQQRSGALGLALGNRAQSLGVLTELRSGNVAIAQAAAVPTTPSSPKVVRNTVLGGVLGLLLGLGVAFLLEHLDLKIKEPKDLGDVYRLPVLGVVPEAKTLARSARRKNGARELLPASEAEAFHLIRAHLRYFNVNRELRTLLITSAAAGDGKTTVARCLAAAAATTGSAVLLLEADLRRPSVAQQLDIQPGPGLADVLIGSVSLRSATQSIELEQTTEQARRLDVLVAGATPPPNPAELIESRAMEATLEQLKSAYDLIVIDTPPVAAVSDAFPLLNKTDGRDAAERFREVLDGVGAPVLGVIANRYKLSGRDAYSYGYAYAQGKQAAPPSSPALPDPVDGQGLREGQYSQ